MSTLEQPSPISDEVKTKAFEKICQVRIYQLFQLAEALNLASTRGAFKGNELSYVGGLFDTLTKGIDQAFKIAKDEVEAAKAQAPVSQPVTQPVTQPVSQPVTAPSEKAGPARLAKVTAGMKTVKIEDEV